MVRLIIKDDGVIFDPTKTPSATYTPEQLLNMPSDQIHLGLTLAKSSSSKFTYKTMYGLNVIYVNFYPEGYVPTKEEEED